MRPAWFMQNFSETFLKPIDGAITVPTGDGADVIGGVIGQPVRHVDIDRLAWVDGAIASGVPAEYGEMLQLLTETIASGGGSRPNDDVRAVTGAPATSFTDFAKRTASAWAEEVAQ